MTLVDEQQNASNIDLSADPYTNDPIITLMRMNSARLYKATSELKKTCDDLINSINERNGGSPPPLIFNGVPVSQLKS
jgi:hypothetical protein